MIRMAYNGDYVHRKAMYAARPGYVALSDATLLTSPEALLAATEAVQYRLPRQMPTPNVTLREDIIPAQRLHSAL